MLETDCKMPTQPVQIVRETPRLYGTALAVYHALEDGQHKKRIKETLNLDEEEYEDAVCEIRKAGKMPQRSTKAFKLSDSDKLNICMRILSGEQKTKIARDYGIALATVIYTDRVNGGRKEIVEKKEQITRRIIEEAAAGKKPTDIAIGTGWSLTTVLRVIKANAEEQARQTEQEEQAEVPTDQAEQEPETADDGAEIVPDVSADDDAEWLEPMPVPAAVFDAVSEKVVEIERKIEMNAAHIKAIKGQNEILREKLTELQTWVEAVR